MTGGPLVDLNGRFLGINYYDTEIGTPFLFFCEIWEILEGMLDDLKAKKYVDRSFGVQVVMIDWFAYDCKICLDI